MRTGAYSGDSIILNKPTTTASNTLCQGGAAYKPAPTHYEQNKTNKNRLQPKKTKSSEPPDWSLG